MNKFGRLIRQLRLQKKWTMKDFIERLEQKGSEISPTYVTKIEVYGEIPNPDVIRKIAKVLKYSSKELLNLAKKEKISQYTKRINNIYEY